MLIASTSMSTPPGKTHGIGHVLVAEHVGRTGLVVHRCLHSREHYASPSVRVMAERDWNKWHDPYDDPDSALSLRLRIVQQRIRETLDRLPPGPITAVSMCAGQGRDLVGTLVDHPRRDDVTARLVELDPGNTGYARASVTAAELTGIDVVTGDASLAAAYEGAVPADIVLVCGVFGNISDADIAHTVESLPQLCAADATVIWTRHRRPPDLTPTVRGWFDGAGFEELAFDAPEGVKRWVSIGTHRFRGTPVALDPTQRLFTFIGDEVDPPVSSG